MLKVLVERGLVWDKALEIYKQHVKEDNDENENSENQFSKNSTTDGFYISNQVMLTKNK